MEVKRKNKNILVGVGELVKRDTVGFPPIAKE